MVTIGLPNNNRLVPSSALSGTTEEEKSGQRSCVRANRARCKALEPQHSGMQTIQRNEGGFLKEKQRKRRQAKVKPLTLT